MPKKTIEDVHREHADRLLKIRGVVGVGIGQRDKQPCLMVLVEKDTTGVRAKIPTTLDGYPVVTEQSGKFTARDES